jgi:renalase
MKSCTVVGAGITGIIAARRLQKKGINVTLLEKSKSIGGRLATRSLGEAVFDFGAQFLTVHSMFFRVVVEDLQDRGLIKEWGRGFLNGDRILNLDGYLRFCGSQGMAAVAQTLAEPLEQVHLQESIVALKQNQQSWKIQAESGKSWESDALILTPPLPQSLALLEKAEYPFDPDLYQRLKAFKYDPCMMVMAVLDGPSGLPEPGALAQADPMSPIAWIADNQIKGISAVPAVSIQSTAHFGRSQWKTDKEVAAKLLWEAAKPFIKANCTQLDIHRWRFGQVQDPLPEPCLKLPSNPPLLLAGDAFGDRFNPVEGAASSGLEAAKLLLKAWE